MEEISITYQGEDIIVTGEYEKAYRGRWTQSNGDPGDEDFFAEFFIDRIFNMEGKEITNEYSTDDFALITEKVLEYYED